MADELAAEIAGLTRDELLERLDYVIAKANEAWLRNGGGDIALDEDEQRWQDGVSAVWARIDEIDERDYVPSPRVAAECARARAAERRMPPPCRGARARGAGRPAGSSERRGGDSGDSSDSAGPGEPGDSDEPPDVGQEPGACRASRRARSPPRRRQLEGGGTRPHAAKSYGAEPKRPG